MLLFLFSPKERLRNESCQLSWPGLGHMPILEPTPVVKRLPDEVGGSSTIALNSSFSFSVRGLYIPCPCHVTGSASCGRGLPALCTDLELGMGLAVVNGM